jgi:hypothetical protein
MVKLLNRLLFLISGNLYVIQYGTGLSTLAFWPRDANYTKKVESHRLDRSYGIVSLMMSLPYRTGSRTWCFFTIQRQRSGNVPY